MDTKTCNTCGECKPIAAFSKRYAKCKVCREASVKAYYRDVLVERRKEQRELAVKEGHKKRPVKRQEYATAGERPCSSCGVVKPMCLFYASSREGFTSACKSCIANKNRAWRTANREKYLAAQHSYYDRNVDKIKERARKFYVANRASRIADVANNLRKHTESMSDRYIVDLLQRFGFAKEDITPELIELHRTCLSIKRTVKEMTK